MGITAHTLAMAKKMSKMASKMAKKVSKIGKKAAVFNGKKVKTASGLQKADLKKTKKGKVVSKKASEVAKKRWVKNGLQKWSIALSKARKQQKVVGFVPLGGKTAKGQALLKAARSFLRQ